MAESDVGYDWNSDDEPPEDATGDTVVVSRDGKVIKTISGVGLGFDKPGIGDEVALEFRILPCEVEDPCGGWHTVTALLGYNDSVPFGVELCSRTMKRKEVARLSMPLPYCQIVTESIRVEEKDKSYSEVHAAGRRGKKRALERLYADHVHRQGSKRDMPNGTPQDTTVLSGVDDEDCAVPMRSWWKAKANPVATALSKGVTVAKMEKQLNQKFRGSTATTSALPDAYFEDSTDVDANVSTQSSTREASMSSANANAVQDVDVRAAQQSCAAVNGVHTRRAAKKGQVTYEVKLVDFWPLRALTDEREVVKKIISHGKLWATPAEGDIVAFNMVEAGRATGAAECVVAHEALSSPQCQMHRLKLIRDNMPYVGLLTVLQSMKRGEVAAVTLSGQYAGPPNTSLEVDSSAASAVQRMYIKFLDFYRMKDVPVPSPSKVSAHLPGVVQLAFKKGAAERRAGAGYNALRPEYGSRVAVTVDFSFIKDSSDVLLLLDPMHARSVSDRLKRLTAEEAPIAAATAHVCSGGASSSVGSLPHSITWTIGLGGVPMWMDACVLALEGHTEAVVLLDGAAVKEGTPLNLSEAVVGEDDRDTLLELKKRGCQLMLSCGDGEEESDRTAEDAVGCEWTPCRAEGLSRRMLAKQANVVCSSSGAEESSKEAGMLLAVHVQLKGVVQDIQDCWSIENEDGKWALIRMMKLLGTLNFRSKRTVAALEMYKAAADNARFTQHFLRMPLTIVLPISSPSNHFYDARPHTAQQTSRSNGGDSPRGTCERDAKQSDQCPPQLVNGDHTAPSGANASTDEQPGDSTDAANTSPPSCKHIALRVPHELLCSGAAAPLYTFDTAIGLLTSIELNAALCCFQLRNFKECVSHCERSLKLTANNSKTLFRKGAAHFELGEYVESVKSLEASIASMHLSPEHNAAALSLAEAELQRAKVCLQKSRKDQKSFAKNMFRDL